MSPERTSEVAAAADQVQTADPERAKKDARIRGSVNQRLRRVLEPLAFPFLLLLAWQLTIIIFDPPRFRLPPPMEVAAALVRPELGWLTHISTTAQEAIGGFLIAVSGGIILALIISWTPILSRLFMPTLVVFETVPKIAIAPLFLIYLGHGVVPNMMLAALIAFFPVLINTIAGLQQTHNDLLDLADSLNAPKWKVFFRIRLPSAVPYILSSARVAAAMATTGAVVGEFLASQAGLGNMVLQTQVSLQTHIAFASLIYLAILGFALFSVVNLVGNWVFPWATKTRAG